jgi:hypothetical protein
VEDGGHAILLTIDRVFLIHRIFANVRGWRMTDAADDYKGRSKPKTPRWALTPQSPAPDTPCAWSNVRRRRGLTRTPVAVNAGRARRQLGLLGVPPSLVDVTKPRAGSAASCTNSGRRYQRFLRGRGLAFVVSRGR